MFANPNIKKETILSKYPSPERRALFDMVKIILGSATIGAIVAVVASYGLWVYLGLALMMVCVVGMLKTLYEMRVSHHRLTDHMDDTE
jgi:hypothetical protein